jgi:hypothetical protein
MKILKKLAAGIFAAAIALNLLFVPTSTANAYTVGKATLKVVEYDEFAASAATDSIGNVSVGLQFRYVDPSSGNTFENGTQDYSDSGHAYCYLFTGNYDFRITYAISYHWDQNGYMSITWDPSNGYSVIY